MKPLLTLEREFELMVNYQVILESKSVVVENTEDDPFRFSLYQINQPYPTYEDYMNCNDFIEGELIEASDNFNELTIIQEARRNQFKSKLELV